MREDDEYICIQSDLDLKVSIVQDGVTISAKNNGEIPIQSVDYRVLFLDKNGKVVENDNGCARFASTVCGVPSTCWHYVITYPSCWF